MCVTYLLELMPKTKPFLLNQNLKAFYCAVIWI